MKLTIIDFNRTLYDPETERLVEGAQEMLDALSKSGVKLVLVSRKEAGREDRLQSLGIEKYFAEIVFTAKKSPELFLRLVETHDSSISEAFVLGDYLAEEITHGNAAGLRTIRLVRGKFAHHVPTSTHDTPWRSVEDLRSVIGLVG